MITGAHAIVYSRDADADRAFFRDVLGFPSVDAGGGWLIFALPLAELAAHPADAGGRHEALPLHVRRDRGDRRRAQAKESSSQRR